jgi:hypothetical protein
MAEQRYDRYAIIMSVTAEVVLLDSWKHVDYRYLTRCPPACILLPAATFVNYVCSIKLRKLHKYTHQKQVWTARLTSYNGTSNYRGEIGWLVYCQSISIWMAQ